MDFKIIIYQERKDNYRHQGSLKLCAESRGDSTTRQGEVNTDHSTRERKPAQQTRQSNLQNSASSRMCVCVLAPVCKPIQKRKLVRQCICIQTNILIQAFNQYWPDS